MDCMPTLESDSDLPVLRNLLAHFIERRVAAKTVESLRKSKIKDENAKLHAQRLAKFEANHELKQIEYDVSQEKAEIRLLTAKIYQELLSQYERGVCCFSTTYNSPVLWSHYGDQHKGICIGYHLNRTPKPVLQKVIYGGNRIINTSTVARALINESKEDQEQLDRDVLLRKAPGWRYEREWRLIGSQGSQDSCLGLKDITFGSRCPESVKHTVVQALKGRRQPVEFYEMSEVRGTYKLRRSQLDLCELEAYMPRTAESGQEIFGNID
jgi:hypothetical protein